MACNALCYRILISLLSSYAFDCLRFKAANGTEKKKLRDAAKETQKNYYEL